MKAKVKDINLSESVKADIKKQFLLLLDRYNYDAALQVLHILHFEFGFGEQRLEKFAKLLNEMQKEQRERYELDEADTPWLCEIQLKEKGIDVKKIVGDNNAEIK